MNDSLIYQSHYTKSEPILDYMTRMLDFKPQDSIFEPCGGDGVFVDKILEKTPSARICIYELNPEAVNILQDKYRTFNNIIIKETDTLVDSDIISGCKKFDKIIGNPPYGARNTNAKKILLNQVYSNLYTKESYTLFLYACISCLKEGGELSFIIPDTFLSLHRHLTIREFILSQTSIKEILLFPSSFFPGINFGYANLCILTLRKCSDQPQNLSNIFRIRQDFKSVEELNINGAGNLKEFSQKEVLERVDAAFMFNSSEELTALINDPGLLKIGDIADCVTGFYSGNDKKYLQCLNNEIKNAKKYSLVNPQTINTGSLTVKEKQNGIDTDQFFIPIVKGGNTRYIKPNSWFMNWSRDAIIDYRNSKKCRFQNSNFYFRNGIGIPMVRSSRITGALIDGRLFDQSIVGVFPKDDSLIKYLLAFFNSSICSKLIEAINPSTNNSANYIKKIPFVLPSDSVRYEVEQLVDNILYKIRNGEEIEVLQKNIDEIFNHIYLDNLQLFKERNRKKVVMQLSLF